MPNLAFNNAEEFIDALYRAHNKNPKYSVDEIWDMFEKNSATIKWHPLSWPDGWDFTKEDADKILSIANWEYQPWWRRDPEEGEAWYEEFKAKQDEDAFNNKSFIEAANDEWFDDLSYNKQLDKLVTDYMNTLNDMRKFVHDNNSGYWMSEKSNKEFSDKLQEYKDKLKEIETSPQFYHLMEWLANGWTWDIFDNWVMNSEVNSVLRMIATWEWSKLFENRNRLKNRIDSMQWTKFDNIMTSLYWDANAFDTMFSTLFTWPLWQWIRSSISWLDAQDIAKRYIKNNKKPAWQNSNTSNETDNMKFWKDVDSQSYVNNRNKELAVILANKWLTTPEQIDEYLNQYDSWKNADENNKRVTLSNLSWLAQSNYNKYIEQRNKDLKDKKDKERRDKWIWLKLDLSPSNDSPLNWEEETTTNKITNKLKEKSKEINDKINDKQWTSDWSDEAIKSMNTYNKYMQLKAEWWNENDMKKFFSSNVWVLWTNSKNKVKDNMKKAWLSNNQINDFVSDWENSFKNNWTKKIDENSRTKSVKKIWEKEKVTKSSPTILNLMKSKK